MNVSFAVVTLPFAAALPENPTFMELVGYQINGLIVVFIALGSIWGLLEISGLFFRRRAARAEMKPALAIPEPQVISSGPAADEALTPEVMAALAAAVHVTCGPDARIAAVVSVEPPASSWGQEGRRQHHFTHKVR